jgi:hypothetical protein
MGSTPEFDMRIPLNHPWAGEIIKRRSYEINVDALWPYGTMEFAGIECKIRLTGVGEINFGHGVDRDYVATTWKVLSPR